MDSQSLLKYTFLIYLIVNLLTLPIPILLMVQVRRRKHRTLEIKIFFQMCIMNLLLCLNYVGVSLLMLGNGKIDIDVSEAIASVFSIFLGILPLVMVVQLLFFVEYTLHHSRDIIKRRYPVVLIPFWIGAVCEVIVTILVFWTEAPMFVLSIINIIDRVVYVILGFYILACYILLYSERKRKAVPEYIRLTPTIVSIVLGLVTLGILGYRLDALGYAIGLLFADFYMFRRLSYTDPESGFYKEKYLAVMRDEAKKKSIQDITVIHFKALQDKEKLVKILKFWEPEFSKIVVKNDGEFLVISELQKKTVAEKFIKLISDNCEKEGIEIESSYETIHN